MTYKLDLIDKRIICALDMNCRTPISQLAKSLRISRNVANYRMDNLEKEGVITNYICSINLGLLGYKTYKIYFRLQSSTEREEKEFVDYLVNEGKVIHLLKNEGAFDYSVAVAVRDIKELDVFLMEVKNKFYMILKDYLISAVIYSKIFKLNKLLLGEKEKMVKIEQYSGEDRKELIDDKDKQILKELSQAANLSIMDLHKKTKLSVDVIKYRLKNLNAKVVNSNRAIIDFNKLGFHHYVFMLKLRQMTKADESSLLSWCASKNNVLYCVKRLGYYEFEINAAIRDINELNAFVGEFKSKFRDKIDLYEMMLNTKLVKLNYVPFD
jgi:Lrp/AsnC family transcriptional regulator